jgi:hypothetical protein
VESKQITRALMGGATEGHLTCRKTGGAGRRKNSFFQDGKKRDFAKVMECLGTLVEAGVGRAFSRKNKNRVKRTVRYHFEGVTLAKWQDEK